jgi:hypothetical protein
LSDFADLEPRRRPAVSSNLILSLMGVLALSLAGSAARAESTSSEEGAGPQTQDPQTNDSQTKASKKKKGSKKKGPKAKDSLDALERGNPHSVRYKSRKKSTHNPTNAEIEAGETANPDAIKQ